MIRPRSSVSRFFEKYASITHFTFVERRPRDNKFFKNKVKFADYRMKWIVLSYSESYFEETEYILVNKFINFPVLKNAIKRIAFANANESSIIFLSTFLPNLRLMRPFSLRIITYFLIVIHGGFFFQSTRGCIICLQGW